MKLEDYLEDQRQWSMKTFGPGQRLEGICKHIEKELEEVRASGGDLMEWIDIVILALDGAWRTGASVNRVIRFLQEKQAINFGREYPFPESEDEPSEHIRQ